jgi:hypothetical protein
MELKLLRKAITSRASMLLYQRSRTGCRIIYEAFVIHPAWPSAALRSWSFLLRSS